MDTTTSITVLGLGTMGRAAADRLAAQGRPITVWNRSGLPSGWALKQGQSLAATPRDAVADADAILLVVSDHAAVTEVTSAIAPFLRDRAMLINLSTVHPDAVAAVRAALPAGVSFVDAPVMGSGDTILAGTAGVMVGADDPVAAEEAAGLLSGLGQVRMVGGLCAPSAIKVTLMSAVIPAVLAVGEAFSVGRRLGLDDDTVLEALRSSPLAAIANRAVSETAAYPARLAAKDLGLVDGIAGRPVADAALGVLRRGPGELDLGAFARAVRTPTAG